MELLIFSTVHVENIETQKIFAKQVFYWIREKDNKSFGTGVKNFLIQ